MENRDIRVVVLLKADEYTWSKEEAAKRDLSHSGYIRKLIIDDRLRVESCKVSGEESNLTTQEPAQQTAQLLTILAEQILNQVDKLNSQSK